MKIQCHFTVVRVCQYTRTVTQFANEPVREETDNLHMRNQRRRSASQ